MPAIAHQNKILGNTSGGGSTILVTTSESSLYGQTVSLTDGTTTMNGTFSNTGECEFTGVMMVGTLTASSGGASTSIQVPYFGVYSMTLSFFSATITVTFGGGTCTCVGNGESYTANSSPYTFTVHGAATYTITNTIDGVSKTDTVTITTDGQSESVTISFGTINVTYDNDFRGVSITCTQGGTTITKTAPSGGNTMYFYPPNTGNWVISGTVSSDTYYSSPNPVVVSSLSTSVSATLETIPDGSTKTPTDDVSIWLSCAGIRDKSYTTLSEVLADSETFNALLGDSNACAYMARSTTWASTLCADQYAMNLIGQYDVCCDALLGNATWASAIANSSYADYVIQPLVPIMTSNTTPSGECVAYSSYTGMDAYKAFDGVASTSSLHIPTLNTANSDYYLGYKFPTATVINKMDITAMSAKADTYYDIAVYGGNDLSNLTKLSSDVRVQGTTLASQSVSFANDTPCLYYINKIVDTNASNAHTLNTYAIETAKIQFYGHKETGEAIHGTYNETAYYLDGATETPIVNPSTLSAGTYTFGSTVAKDPSDLTADYTKTIRITPNTKEIVLRPDCALYWYGVIQNCGNATGYTWESRSFITPTYNNQDVTITAGSSTYTGVGSTYQYAVGTVAKIIAQGLTAYSNSYGSFIGTPNKDVSNQTGLATVDSANTAVYSFTVTTSASYIALLNAVSRSCKLSALWTE